METLRNIDSLKLPSKESGISFLLMGSTRSGKTTMMNYLYDSIFRNHITILHTYSSQAKIYRGISKSCVLCPDYYPELLDETYKINKNCDNEYEFLHIIDDVVDKKNDAQIKKLLTIYRNSRISGIITGQSLTIFNNIARGNINYVMLGFLNSDASIEQCIKAYLLSYFPTGMKMIDKIKRYKELTADHHFFVIDNIHGDVFRTKLTHSQIL
jgi:hypothetical protein